MTSEAAMRACFNGCMGLAPAAGFWRALPVYNPEMLRGIR